MDSDDVGEEGGVLWVTVRCEPPQSHGNIVADDGGVLGSPKKKQRRTASSKKSSDSKSSSKNRQKRFDRQLASISKK